LFVCNFSWWVTLHGKANHQALAIILSLFEIAQSLFALERTFILGAMALLETKSGAHLCFSALFREQTTGFSESD